LGWLRGRDNEKTAYVVVRLVSPERRKKLKATGLETGNREKQAGAWRDTGYSRTGG